MTSARFAGVFDESCQETHLMTLCTNARIQRAPNTEFILDNASVRLAEITLAELTVVTGEALSHAKPFRSIVEINPDSVAVCKKPEPASCWLRLFI